MKRPERVAAVEKIEEERKPEDFFGHRNRTKVPMMNNFAVVGIKAPTARDATP